MTYTLYYFSGTGNTLYLAKQLSKTTKATLIPIASKKHQKTITPVTPTTGILFPVYYNDLPVLVKKFAQKLTGIENTTIFAVSTYGGSAGNSLDSLKKIIHERGGNLSHTYGIHMPQNAFNKPWENHQKIYQTAYQILKNIPDDLTTKKQVNKLSNLLIDILFKPLGTPLRKITTKTFEKKLKSKQSLPKLIHNMDQLFSVDENCTHCGICQKVCPVQNISMNNNKITWHHKCENCLACQNYCPSHSIHGKISQKNYYYHHPEIKAEDIAQQQ